MKDDVAQQVEDYEEMLSVYEGTVYLLREAIATWPCAEHDHLCDVKGNSSPHVRCTCTADAANAARASARRMAGLEV